MLSTKTSRNILLTDKQRVSAKKCVRSTWICMQMAVNKVRAAWKLKWLGNFSEISPTWNFMKIHSIVQVVLRVLTDRFDRRCAGLETHLEISETLTDLALRQRSFLRFRWLFKFFVRDFLYILLTNRRKSPNTSTYQHLRKILQKHNVGESPYSKRHRKYIQFRLQFDFGTKLYRILYAIF